MWKDTFACNETIVIIPGWWWQIYLTWIQMLLFIIQMEEMHSPDTWTGLWETENAKDKVGEQKLRSVNYSNINRWKKTRITSDIWGNGEGVEMKVMRNIWKWRLSEDTGHNKGNCFRLQMSLKQLVSFLFWASMERTGASTTPPWVLGREGRTADSSWLSRTRRWRKSSGKRWGPRSWQWKVVGAPARSCSTPHRWPGGFGWARARWRSAFGSSPSVWLAEGSVKVSKGYCDYVITIWRLWLCTHPAHVPLKPTWQPSRVSRGPSVHRWPKTTRQSRWHNALRPRNRSSPLWAAKEGR